MKQELYDFFYATKNLFSRKRVIGTVLGLVCVVAGGEPGTCLATFV